MSKKLESHTDNTVKYLYELEDGNHVESVIMEYNYGNTICVSTQVGCKMGCRFCASTIAGFKRDLTSSEILGQIYASERDSGRKISGVVLMGKSPAALGLPSITSRPGASADPAADQHLPGLVHHGVWLFSGSAGNSPKAQQHHRTDGGTGQKSGGSGRPFSANQ